MASQIQTGEVSLHAEATLYSRSYDASISVIKNIVPFINGDGACAKLKTTVTAVPMLIAAGLMGSVSDERREQSLCEAALCCREAIVILSYCRDLHSRFVNRILCSDLISTYTRLGAELDLLLRVPKVDGGAE